MNWYRTIVGLFAWKNSSFDRKSSDARTPGYVGLRPRILNKAIVDSILRPRCPLSSPFPTDNAFSMGKKIPSRRYAMRPIVNVPQENRATDTGNMHKKIGKDRACGSRDICIVNGEENPFPAIRDAVYHKRGGGGPSHRHRQHAQKLGKYRTCGSGDILADRHTQTDMLITILRNCSRGRSNNCE